MSAGDRGEVELKWLRFGVTAWMLLWTPIILWAYGPQNFLWLCNLALFLMLYSLWSRNPLVLSSQAGIVVLIGLVWTLDFVLGLVTSGRTAVVTAYMFDLEIPLAARAVSLYHVFMPVVVIRALLTIGYDRRGPWLQCLIGGLAIVVTWLFTDPERNINWVASPFHSDELWMPEPVWVLILILAGPLAIYWTGHRIVLWVLGRFGRPGSS